MMFTHNDYPERSWSFSKYNVFKECKRKYYYNTFGQWNGWEPNCSAECRKTYLLKKLENVYTLSGKYIHDSIKTSIKASIKGKKITYQGMYDEIVSKLRKACVDSLSKLNEWKETPKDYNILHEYYYGGNLEKELGEKIKQRTLKCCENYFKSFSFQNIREEKVVIFENDEKIQSFMFNDVKIYVKLDLMYNKNDQIIIVDWKSGTAEEKSHQLQMLVYYLYIKAQEKYQNLNTKSILCIDEYLLTGKRFTELLNEQEISKIEDFIYRSMEEMDAYLDDVKLNKPKDKICFPQNKKTSCSGCNFLELCKNDF